MSLLHDAVKRLERVISDSGCGDGKVSLYVDNDAETCAYPKGVCLIARFGGRSGEIITDSPVRATTRISFMYDAPLSDAGSRSAAYAIVNAVMGFLCLSRRLKACSPEAHEPCFDLLMEEIGSSRVFLVGDLPPLVRSLGDQLVSDPEEADLLLAGGTGLVSDEGVAMLDRYAGKKRVLFLGPSSGGMCALLDLEHWCPYGRP